MFTQLRKHAGFHRRRDTGEFLINPRSREADLELLRELESAELRPGLKNDQPRSGSHLLEDTRLGPRGEAAEIRVMAENNDIPLFLVQKPVKIFQFLGLQRPGDRRDIHTPITQSIHSPWPLIENRIEGEIEALLELRHFTPASASRHQKENLGRAHIVGSERLGRSHKPLRPDLRPKPAVHSIRRLESARGES